MQTPYGEIPDRLAAGMSLAEQHDWLQVRASRRTVLRGLVLAGASASPLLWQRPARATGTVRVLGRMLAPGVDPTTDMTVAVAVPDPFRGGQVVAAAAESEVAIAPLEVHTVRGSATRYGRAMLTGLKPDTGYSYSVVLDGVAAARGSFRTAPALAASFRFTAFGDQGVGGHSRALMRRVAALAPDLHLIAGDLCYANLDGTGGPGRPGQFRPRAWDAWLAQNDRVAGRVPVLCALGNHEMEPGYPTHGYAGVLARLPLPGMSPLECPASWAVQYGTVGFVGLDSNDVSYELRRNFSYSGGAQRSWLESVLSRFRAPDAGVEFVVAVLHHSAYSTNEAHGSEGGVRDFWVPLFDQYGVDLVIAGHNHCYERTLPLRGGQVVGVDSDRVDSRNGTTYVTAGGGGAVATPRFIEPGMTRVYTRDGMQAEHINWSLPAHSGRHAVVVADVQPGPRLGSTSTLRLRAVDEHGDVLDSVVLQRPAVWRPVPAARAGTSSNRGLIVAGSATAAAALTGGAAAAVALHRRSPAAPEHDLPPPTVPVRPLLDRPASSRSSPPLERAAEREPWPY